MNFSSPSECFTAQTIPGFFANSEVNPDVGGVAVAASNIVINLALPILVHWAQDAADVHTTVIMLLSQVYPIMIATAGSINTDNLTLFDAHFAVAVTASPVSFYLVYSSFRDLIGCPNLLFSKLGKGKMIVRLLGLTLPVLWLGVNVIISFSPTAFKDSHMYCQDMTFARWFEFQAVSNFVGVLDVMGRRDMWNDLQGRGGLGAISLGALWIWAVYLVRHRCDIRDEIRYRRAQQGDRNPVIKKWLYIYNLPAASWYVIPKSHPWMLFVIIICLHWSWMLGIAKGMMSNTSYQLSYGQITSLFSAVPPILAVWNLLRSRWGQLYMFAQTLPASFRDGLRFLIFGSPNPWDIHFERHAPLLPLQTCTLEGHWFIIGFIWIVLTVLDVLWILVYVRAGSIPNPRNFANNPHEAWKPFSVAMYVYGYIICCLNILVWTTFYDDTRIMSSKAGAWFIWWWNGCSRRRRICKSLKVMMIPLALVMCIAPMFSPFAALPLAQEWQWNHFCDSFEGEVILRGAIDPSHVSTASFFYPRLDQPTLFDFHYNFTLVGNSTNNQDMQVLSLNGSISDAPAFVPDLVKISYNLTDQSNSFEATCMHQSGNSMSPGLCGYGRYTTNPYLSFSLLDLQAGAAITRLRAVDKEWQFPDDAPSVVVRFEQPDGTLGDISIQSAVTQRNHCDTLKLCLPSRNLSLASLVPLGVILGAQQTFAEYCSRPRIYSI